MIQFSLISRCIHPVNAFNAFDLDQVHDQIVQIAGIMDVKVDGSFENSVMAVQVDCPDIHAEFFGNYGGNIVIYTEFIVTVQMNPGR